MYNHTIASTEISGIEASTAPTNELHLAISEIATIRIVVITILVA
jgi:hypothetical protein